MHSISQFLTTSFGIFVDVMSVLIIIRVLMSWFTMSGRGGFPGGEGSSGASGVGNFARIVTDITEPVINLAKKLPHKAGMIDFSPIIALLGLDLLEYLITMLLSKL